MNANPLTSVRTFVISACLLLAAAAASAQMPREDVSAERHPNLAAAQGKMRDAYDLISRAQQSNQGELGGHAEKAKHLLFQASEELKLAARAASAPRH